MKISFPSLIFALIFSTQLSNQLSAQEPDKFRFSKDRHPIYFFQKGTSSSVLIPGKTDLFYLLVPDSLKPYLLITSENADLVLQKNDSLVRCQLLPGIRYEHYYRRDDKRQLIYTIGVNGASVIPHKEVLIQFIDKRTDVLIFKNTFTVREN